MSCCIFIFPYIIYRCRCYSRTCFIQGADTFFAEDNTQLISPFTEEEFKQATFQMHSDKAAGLDGLNPAFYQRFWDLCGNDIFTAKCSWLHEGSFPEHLNNTNVVLIPNVMILEA